jgi:phage-related protein
LRTHSNIMSFNNVSDEQAIEAMSSAMMGETEMAKALGLGLNESVMKTSEFTLATGKSWEELTRAERAQVYYQEAVKQSSNAIGDAERSSGSYTNQMKTLKAKLEEVGQTIGGALIPALTPLITKMSEMVSSLDMSKINQFINVGLMGLATAFNFLKPYIIEMIGVIKTLFSETQIGGQVIKFVAELWAIYGSQIIATVRLMLSTIVSNWKSSVSILTSIWKIFGENIKTYIKGVVAAVIQIVNGLLNVLQGIFKLMASVLKGDWQGAWNAIKQIGKGAVDVVVGIVKAFFNQLKGLFGAGVTVIKGIWGKVKYALMSGIDSGVNYVIGRINAMMGKINSAIRLINNIPGVNLPTIKNIPQTASKTLSQVYGHASGGILTKPTFSGNHLAGEAGAEAIIPLTNKTYVKPFAQTIADMIGHSGGVTVNMYGTVVREEADITKVARQLQYEIDKKNRAKGVK